MSKMYRLSIIVPTYNEKESISKLLPELCKLKLNQEIIVVDDSSPDGTADAAEELAKIYRNIRVLRRKERGLSSAILYGIKHSNADIVCGIDADLQHPPSMIPKMLEEMRKHDADIVIASRYKGGSMKVKFSRRLLSKGTILISRIIFPRIRRIKDPFTGLVMMKKSVLSGVEMHAIGYRFLLEVLIKGKYSHAVEIPLEFKARKYGKTKLDFVEHVRHMWILIRLRLS